MSNEAARNPPTSQTEAKSDEELKEAYAQYYAEQCQKKIMIFAGLGILLLLVVVWLMWPSEPVVTVITQPDSLTIPMTRTGTLGDGTGGAGAGTGGVSGEGGSANVFVPPSDQQQSNPAGDSTPTGDGAAMWSSWNRWRKLRR